MKGAVADLGFYAGMGGMEINKLYFAELVEEKMKEVIEIRS